MSQRFLKNKNKINFFGSNDLESRPFFEVEGRVEFSRVVKVKNTPFLTLTTRENSKKNENLKNKIVSP